MEATQTKTNNNNNDDKNDNDKNGNNDDVNGDDNNNNDNYNNDNINGVDDNNEVRSSKLFLTIPYINENLTQIIRQKLKRSGFNIHLSL